MNTDDFEQNLIQLILTNQEALDEFVNGVETITDKNGNKKLNDKAKFFIKKWFPEVYEECVKGG